MNDDDDLSKTMVIPNPGGRRKTAGLGQTNDGNGAMPGAQTGAQVQTTPAQANLNYAQGTQINADVKGENPLLDYSRDLLILAGNLRSFQPSNTIEQLRTDIENLFARFNKSLQDDNTSEEVILTARYLLCCLIDELVLSTPWGIESAWSHQTLLGKYHNETSGGEKFFLIANKLMEQPQRNIDLIELAYVCLGLGFRGKYRISSSGENDVLQISQMLYQPITLYRPQSNDLSPAWQGATDEKPSFEKRFPPILFFLVFAFICIAVYIALLSNLHAKSSPLYEKIEDIGWDDFVLQVSERSPDADLNSIVASLRSALSESISQGLVAVEVRDGIVIVRLTSTQLFPPGSTRVNPQQVPEVNKLTRAIAPFAETLVIVGHTDSTGRADSNWVISRKRAEAVEAWLKTAQQSVGQTVTRGVADTQPLVTEGDPNFSQSLNRRVELMLVLKDA
jgi:type VI secretion system protein ImpK